MYEVIYKTLKKYDDDEKENKLSGEKSWEYCYRFFRDNDICADIDKACLHLGFYLASWGMMRGGSFLSKKNYMIHEVLIKKILLNKEGELSYIPPFELIEKDGYRYYFKNTRDIYEGHYLTDTLITKILMGVFCNIPAYDNYLKTSFRKLGIVQTLNEESFEEFVKFSKNTEVNRQISESKNLKICQFDNGDPYPDIKILDSFLWFAGRIILGNIEVEEELLHGIIRFADNYKQEGTLKGG